MSEKQSLSSASKGVAATIMTVIIIIAMLLLLMVFIANVNNESSRRIGINLKEAEALKLVNAFDFANRSLGMMWYISSAQSVFEVFEKSYGCGFEDDSAIKERYWYDYEKTGPKALGRLYSFLDDADEQKQNDFEPYVCYPTEGIVQEMLEDDFEFFKDAFAEVDDKMLVGDIPVTVENIQSSISIEDNDNSRFEKNSDGVRAVSTQKLTVGTTESNRAYGPTINNNKIFVPVADVLEAGRRIVRNFALLSDKFMPNSLDSGNEYDISHQYQDIAASTLEKNGNTYTPDENYIAYLQRIEETIKAHTPDISNLRKIVKRKNLSLSYATNDYAPLFGADPDTFDVNAIILDYEYKITYAESAVAYKTCTKPLPNNYGSIIEQAVQEKGEADEWKFESGGILGIGGTEVEFSSEEIVAFVEGVVQQESSWNPEIVSCAGAAGLGQLMPGTARDQGLNVPEYEEVTIICAGRRWSAFECNSNTRDLCSSSDERFDPEKNIRGSVSYIHSLLGQMKTYTSNKDELLRLVAAAYNAGPGDEDDQRRRGVIGAIIRAHVADRNNVRYDEIQNELPEETQGYVPNVMGYYLCYGGILATTEGYYFHDEATNNFIKRPFSAEIGIKDAVPVVDCNENPYRDSTLPAFDPATEINPEVHKYAQRYNWLENNDRALACCAGKLWSCDYNLPGLIASQNLVTGRVAGGACQTQLLNLFTDTPAGRLPTPLSLQCSNAGFIFVPTTTGSEPAGCESATDLTACRNAGDCYWVATGLTTGSCRTCSGATSCSSYNNNPDACQMCEWPKENCISTVDVRGGFDVYRCTPK